MRYFYLFLLLGLFSPSIAQQRLPTYLLNGRVISSANAPVSGATVILVGTANGAQSTADGSFSISAVAGKYRLRVTYLGFRPVEQEVVLPVSSTLIFRLYPADNELKEVIVSTGYQELPKERATGSFVQVDRQLLERSVSTDIIDRLQNVVPGLSFNNVGTRLSIRGQSTIFSNADPLIVVDGFPFNQPIEDLNPNDVESITVLKDAAAASIWGTRAGNGVIVVTTKKGRFNKPPSVNLNTNIRVGARPDLFKLNRLSSSDYIDIERRLFNEGYFLASETADGHPPLSPVTELLIGARDGNITSAEADRQIALLRNNDVRNDISRYLNRVSINQQYALSLDGGTLNYRYFVSAGFDKDLDNLRGNGYDRVTLNSSNNWSLLQNKIDLSLGINLTRSLTERDNPGNLTWNRGNLIYPYASLADPSGNALAYTKDHRQSFLSSAARSGLLDWQYRQLDELRNADNNATLFDQRVNTALRYRIIPGLQLQVQYQYDHTNNNGHNLQGISSYYTRDLINRFTQVDASGNLTRPVPVGGILDLDNNYSDDHDIRWQLSYNKQFGPKNELSAIAGYELQSLHVQDNTYRLYGYDQDHATSKTVDGVTSFPYYDNPLLGSTIPLNQNETDATDHYRSYYANAAYTYDRRYTLSASARLDQSNLFGVNTDQKGVPLYSAGVAWNVSNERSYRVTWLPVLKLRATYGYNGNINKTLSAFTTANYFNGSDSQTRLPYAYILNPPNPDLKWERIRIINLGIDFALAGNRLSGTVEYYLKNGFDLFGQSGYPPSSGVTTFTGNNANTAGHGLDLNLSSHNLTGQLGWNTDFFISYVTDKVTRYDKPSAAVNYVSDNGQGNYALQGEPLYGIYSYQWAGLDPQTGDPRGYLNGTVSKDYNAILTAATSQNLTYSGPSRPLVFGSLRNTLTYKNLSFSGMISYKLGYYFRRNSVRYGNNYGLSGQNGDYALRWQRPGDEQVTNVPSVPASANIQRDDLYTYSTILVDKGDHIRLQDLRLSYGTGSSRSPFPYSSMQLFIYATNIGIIWRANHDHLDPDVPNSYPAPRTIAAGLRLTL